MGLKEPEERELVNPWAICDVESENGPQQARSNASKESKGLMASP